ncbi:Pyruvate, phosphate dikinase [Nereida ignava]|uniref:Pyruvate, phosphate dikinase n=2 Tax=Nereida ignava TaxID=282199 RepID=A0A0U1NJE8_9RHOB|nr:putative PEP-binding protein [Nereida ignava]CRK74825.1 Pyruvate, phosphate dikinase [Nereida ignava]SFJ62344.1 pyruvate phosphate dikinase [Nereida ignava DSM 16309]
MQQAIEINDFTVISAQATMAADTHGGRAKCLQRLIRLDMPVPRTVALPFKTVRAIANGMGPDLGAILAEFAQDALFSVRPSSQDSDWGGPSAVLNIGMNDARFTGLSDEIGTDAAALMYLRFVQSYAVNVARLDPDEFTQPIERPREALDDALRAYFAETDEVFPQDPKQQLGEVLRSMARAWEGTTAHLLRQAKGAPADAGLGLVVQEMKLGVGRGNCGSGVIMGINQTTGERMICGRFLGQSQGRDAMDADRAIYLTRDARGPSLEERHPELYAQLLAHMETSRGKLREEMEHEFTIQDGELFILDGIRVTRSARAAVNVAVALAQDKIIAREDALLRIPPNMLSELLHRQVAAGTDRNVVAKGLAASPGAAMGQITFSANEAQALAAQGEKCILVRRETAPEDIRGMNVAAGVLTERGGMTSHAAVIGRGLGLPSIVGAAGLSISARDKTLTTQDGLVLKAGDKITIDGTTGEVLVGEVTLVEPSLDGAFQTLLGWADEVRDIGVRANADTPADAQTARNFAAEGIGLCRTEHMFFDGDRLTVMREMIFADTSEDRRAALERLLPMQRDDFGQLFEIMAGLPVCIRLFDPPLHEILPSDRDGMRDLAEAMNLPLSDVIARVDQMSEFNPMLGLRGVRLGITLPEIYDMQAQAIFEATAAAHKRGHAVTPEIMLPLVSAKREVELLKIRIDAVASAVMVSSGQTFDYKLGVMVETPRAALRAGDIAQHSAFLSFGTNDLTQMTYGLSRDDAGRFMSTYVQQQVFAEDPFQYFDEEGVGELVQIGADRGRATAKDVVLSICGEHGGSAPAMAFARAQGFDYVSCSPFRVPVARLIAAQLALGRPS